MDNYSTIMEKLWKKPVLLDGTEEASEDEGCFVDPPFDEDAVGMDSSMVVELVSDSSADDGIKDASEDDGGFAPFNECMEDEVTFVELPLDDGVTFGDLVPFEDGMETDGSLMTSFGIHSKCLETFSFLQVTNHHDRHASTERLLFGLAIAGGAGRFFVPRQTW